MRARHGSSRTAGRPASTFRAKGLLSAALALVLSCPAGAAPASGNSDRQPNPALWGTSGLMTVPTAEILPNHHFNAALSYFPLNSGLSASGTISLLEDLEAGLVFGVPPANGFSALAASIKYRIMNQAKGQPLSLALGASLLGLGETSTYVPGSNVFLVLSRSFDWEQTRIVNLHGGFMGGLGGARAVAGLDVPILDLARVELEYLGNLNSFSQALNLGLVLTPIQNLTLQAALMQRTGSFWDRDFILSVGWHGDWGQWFGLNPAPTPSSGPTAEPSATPSTRPSPHAPAKTKGTVRIRAIDEERIIALEKAHVSLNQPEAGLHFEGKTDVMGETRFERIPTGTYEVLVEKDGWAPEERKLSVQKDLETFLEIPLSGKGGTIYGQIETAGGGSPGDLDVEVIDQAHLLIRRLNLTGSSYRVDKIPPGAYTLVVKQEGDERLRLNILVKANAESQYDLTLPPDGKAPVSPGPSVMPSASPSAMPSATPSPAPSVAPSASPEPSLTPPPLPSPAPTTAPTAAPTPTPGPVSARLEGLVKSKAGAILQGVRIELKNDDLLVITLSTNEGKYVFRDIPQGVFRLQLSKDGFKSRAFQITINKSEVMKNDFELEPGP